MSVGFGDMLATGYLGQDNTGRRRPEEERMMRERVEVTSERELFKDI